jgi:hypothetical protein
LESSHPFPDFFLVGAPRCGTTSLSLWLSRHPQVCFSLPKETHFFSRIARELPGADLRRHYLDAFFTHFDPARHRAVGEGSVSYLYDFEALERILALRPAARFLVMARSPLTQLPSYHQRLLYILEEDVRDFGEAWGLQAERARGRRIPRRCTDPTLLRYEEIGKLGSHIGRLRERVGAERCHVVLHDDLAARPRETWLGVLRFLGLPDDGRQDFPIRRASLGYRSTALQRLARPRPALAPKALKRLLGAGAALPLARLRRRLKQRNRFRTEPAALSPALRETLVATYAEDVARLGGLLGRDLGHWLAPPAPARAETQRLATSERSCQPSRE